MQPKLLLTIQLLITLFLLTACMGGSNKAEQSYEYIPLSKFTIDSNAIASGSAIQILAYSGGEESKKEKINYFQFIVVNKRSGDTVRVLTAIINVPGESDKGTYTSPILFDGDKGVFEATFELKDSTQNMVTNLSALLGEKDHDMEAMKKIVADTSNNASGEEWVVVNKSIPIFENSKYKTTIGILKFSSVPW